MARFPEVYKAERDFIYRARSRRNSTDSIEKTGDGADTLGVAFSGGGIRSATFSMGAIQAIAASGWLCRLDYISGVSGGSYALAWLVSWIYREGSVVKVQDALNTHMVNKSGDDEVYEEIPQIAHTRHRSNYLTPNLDFLRDDRWVFLCTYVINLASTLGVTLPLLSFILMTPIVFFVAIVKASDSSLDYATIATGLLLAGFVPLTIKLKSDSYKPKQTTVINVVSQVLCYVFSVLLSFHVVNVHNQLLDKFSRKQLFSFLTGPSDKHFYGLFFVGLLVVIFFTISASVVWVTERRLNDKVPWLKTTVHVCMALLSALVVIAITAPWSMRLALRFNFLSAPKDFELFVFGPVAGVVIVTTTLIAVTNVVVTKLTNRTREAVSWWLGRLFLTSSFMLFLSFVSFFGPEIMTRLRLSAPILLLIISCGLASLMLGLRKIGDSGQYWVPLWNLVSIIPMISVIAAILLVWSFAVNLMKGQGSAQTSSSWSVLQGICDPPVVVAYWMGSFVLAFLASYFTGSNRFSMSAFYRNRLINCYLVAGDKVNPRHQSGELVRDENDIKLCALDVESYDGPYPIINAALNSLRSNQLAWQERKACSFIFTPKYCGFEVSSLTKDMEGLRDDGFLASDRFDHGRVSLGQAISISGAAIGTYMGSLSSRPLAFLLTLFNFRLGWWLPNPRIDSNKVSERNGLITIIKELFGLTSEHASEVHVSDGGHFENLGIYELVKRRCRVIVAIDGTADPDHKLHSFAGAIEKCRVDLGIDINLITPVAESDSPWLKATVHYQRVGLGEDGTLIIVKCGNNISAPFDVRSYANENKAFPHDATRNQWFGERQFESYRAIGYCTTKAFLDSDEPWMQMVKKLLFQERLPVERGTATAGGLS